MTALPTPGAIPEIGSPGADRFQSEIRPAGRPAVIRGLAAHWPAVEAARKGDRDIVDYLLSFGPARPVSGIMALPQEGGRFFYTEDMTGLNFRRQQGHLAAFLSDLLKAADDADPIAMAVQSESLPEVLPGFAEANSMPLLPGVDPRIWIGNRIHVAPHYDLKENIAVCLAGKRRFTVFPPDQLANLYPGPFELTPAGTPVSMVDPSNPDLDRYPRFAQAWGQAMQATLGPGDAIYLPFAWWHGVEALEPVSILVNYWWNQAPEGAGGGYDALLHALMSYRHLPADERKVWRMMLDHYVFGDEDPAAHLPDHAKGILGPASPRLLAQMRQVLKSRFTT